MWLHRAWSARLWSCFVYRHWLCTPSASALQSPRLSGFMSNGFVKPFMLKSVFSCKILLNLKRFKRVCFCLQSQAYEFQFGLQYAWTMCIVAVSMTYSITCPIIMPFGEQNPLQLPSSLFPSFFLSFMYALSLPYTVTSLSSTACQSDADCVNLLL